MATKSHSFYVSNGILDPHHFKVIGKAIWTFLWCIDKETQKEINGKTGWVLGGQEIKTETIAEQIGASIRTIKDHLRVLVDGGYLETVRTQYGQKIRITKAKKWTRRSEETCTSKDDPEVKKPALLTASEVQKSVSRSEETCTSPIIRMDRQDRQKEIDTSIYSLEDDTPTNRWLRLFQNTRPGLLPVFLRNGQLITEPEAIAMRAEVDGFIAEKTEVVASELLTQVMHKPRKPKSVAQAILYCDQLSEQSTKSPTTPELNFLSEDDFVLSAR